jgi:hypothetical protein
VVQLCRHAELAPVEPGAVLVTVSIGPANEAIVVGPAWAEIAD